MKRLLFTVYLPLLFLDTKATLTLKPFNEVCYSYTQQVSRYDTISSNTSATKDYDNLKMWIAGKTVSLKSIEKFGKDKCFCQSTIDSKLFERIYKKSYKKNCTIPLKDLRYLKVLHVDSSKQIHLGELICHKDISNDLIDIFKTLFEANYPIERMVLIDNYNAIDELSMHANNTSCFNFRQIAGSNKLSSHSSGHAIDINPLYNPFIKIRKGIVTYQPKNSKAYLNRNQSVPYMIKKGDLCYNLFIKHGFTWGGNWKSVKDFQHFEKR